MPSPDGRVDLRSDTVTPTRPCAGRCRSRVGETSTARTRRSTAWRARRGPGRQGGGLYVPAGTMGNQIARRVLSRPGTEVRAPPGPLASTRRRPPPENAGVQIRTLHDRDGTSSPAAVDGRRRGVAHHLPPLSLVAIENTHIAGRGRALVPGAGRGPAAAPRTTCRHCDGAACSTPPWRSRPTRRAGRPRSTRSCSASQRAFGPVGPCWPVRRPDRAAGGTGPPRRRHGRPASCPGRDRGPDQMVDRWPDDHARAAAWPTPGRALPRLGRPGAGPDHIVSAEPGGGPAGSFPRRLAADASGPGHRPAPCGS